MLNKQNISQNSFLNPGTQTEASKPGDKWKISNSLQLSKAQWAEVLIDIYEHPMSFPGSVSPQAGELLRALVVNIAPRNVLEIGSYIGASTIWIASAMSEYERRNKLCCIDLFLPHTDNPWCPGVELIEPLSYIKNNIKKCGFQSFIELYQGDSKDLIPKIAKQIHSTIDFVIIDGDHSFMGCSSDFNLVEPFVSLGGYILFHDTFPDYCGVDGPAITLETKIFTNRDKFEVCQIYTEPLNFGFALLRKVTN
ncbi:hypothetical protein MTBBW1_560003 [Desulfamplus magnetovallimortis]|uniref:Class I SAM-dependent methyltransferase n=1 Tax=Desulfamplus magnetovallimortis TaxID=1246637 RepID=A0A1W1HHY0_9BACT|nr:class I SAM-dependent methyltransferase [Desulfamplus magnetovallimortis]SLM32079.1 hypothetical protein MTBBW1_560003 [Desulfamplus magnetovallimortis]